MRRISVASALLPAMLLLPCSCIKENRGDCPCCLILELGEVDNHSAPSLTVDLTGATDFHLIEEISDYSFERVFEVPRGKLFVNVFHIADGDVFSPDKGFVVDEGRDYPELWLHNSVLNTSVDVRRDTVRLHKSYSRLDMHILSDGRPVDFDLGVDGKVCGYSLDGKPEDGVFRVSLRPDGNGDCQLCVPRQKDSSLSLSIVDDGDVLRRFALGEYIVRSGFDWTRADLEDIDVTIDFSRTTVNFRICNWETSYSFEIEI